MYSDPGSLANCTLLRPGGVDVPATVSCGSEGNEFEVCFRAEGSCGELGAVVAEPLAKCELWSSCGIPPLMYLQLQSVGLFV